MNATQEAGPSSWQHTPWGRILVGLLVAQGLCYGLQQFFTAGLIAATGETEGDNVWSTLTGLLLLQGLQLIGLLAGGTLVGAGQQRGLLYGALVGIWNGILFLVLHGGSWSEYSVVTLYGQPILQMAFGAVGGYIGQFIWPPPPMLETSGPAVRQARPTRKSPSPLDGPIVWWRVLMGAVVAVGGNLWARVILDLVVDTSRGKLSVTSHLEDQLLTYEIIALALFFGSALAGATTSNGLKQGMAVGILAATILLGFKIGGTAFHLESMLFEMLLTLGMSLAGGWFGGQLFPPLLPARPRGIGPEA